MDKSFRVFIIVAVIMVLSYIGFELYNSINGNNVTFGDTITPIRDDLGNDVLDHINTSASLMVYYNHKK